MPATPNITQGRHATRDAAESDDIPDMPIDALRRDGLPIIPHEYTASDGSDIIRDGMPGEIESIDSIMRILDTLRVVPKPGGGDISIVLPDGDPDERRPTDERLGYALCTIGGEVHIRIWTPATTIFNEYPRKIKRDGSDEITDLIRAEYVKISETMITDVQRCLQQICRVWYPWFYPDSTPRMPKFDRRTISDAIERVAAINGRANPVLEIAQTTDWDGTPRMANFFKVLGYTVPKSCGLTPEEANYYLECVGRWTFLGMIERQIRPILYDQILILWADGPDGNGTGKSSTVRAIANGFYAKAGAMPREKTASTDREFWKTTVGSPAVEMKEGEQWTKYNNDAIKILAETVQYSYVEKYQTNTQTHDVGCIFVCTTNRKEIIQDPDGNTRRFLPLMASRNADGEQAIDVLLRLELEDPGYIDQIYAEALTTIENAPVPREVWRNGSESGNWAYNEEFMRGIQRRVCSESLDKDPRVEDLAQYIKDRLTSEAIDAPDHVTASEIEQDYRNTKTLDEIGYDEHRQICRALHKSGTAKLYGLEFYVTSIDGRSCRAYRLYGDPNPAGPSAGRRRRSSKDPPGTSSDTEGRRWIRRSAPGSWTNTTR